MKNIKLPSKKSVLNFIQAVVFLLIAAILFGAYTFIFRDKNEANIVKPFYDELDNSLDIVVIGSSHVMCGFYAMELYDEFGYTSYGFASSSQLLPQSYYQVAEALRTQTPQLMILDVGGAVYDELYGSKAYAHVQTDNMPFSMNKINLIEDLFEKEDRLSYYLNLIQFHTRWKTVTTGDFSKITGTTKGAYVSYSANSEISLAYPEARETHPLSENAETYLRKTIELCRDRDIPLLLINFPGSHTEEDYKKLNAVGDIADEYGVPYLNLQYHLEEMGFDEKTDFRDPYHCNASGAYKVTTYLGGYLEENFDISTERSEKITRKWENDLAAYRAQYPEGHCTHK